ncbi:MAG: hypothetical protein RLY86_45 [Pseudomonadota bacterium]|jgi:type VI secretion system protein ImpB
MDMTPQTAPNGRINISYTLDGASRQMPELPLRLAVIGDFAGRDDDTTIADRKMQSVSRANFDTVMAAHRVEMNLNVPMTIGGGKGEANVTVKARSLADFEPDQVIEQMRRQIPALDEALKLRDALVSLKGPMGTKAGFRRELQAIIDDTEKRSALMRELGIVAKD